MNRRRGALLASLLLLAPTAHAQDPTRACLGDVDAGGGLSMAVDGFGRVHFSRIRRVSGRLLYTVVAADGSATDAELTGRVSRLGGEEVGDTDLLLVDARPRICFRDVLADALKVALFDGEAWRIETVAEGQQAGAACALGRFDGRLAVAWSQAGQLHYAERHGLEDWRGEVAHAPGDAAESGAGVDLAAGPDGPVMAHGDSVNGVVLVTRRLGAGWETTPSGIVGVSLGVRPALVVMGDEVRVLHGGRSARLDAESDGGAYLSSGRLGGVLVTEAFRAQLSLGGSNAALLDGEGRLLYFTRERLRSALFGAFDGLYLYVDVDGEQAEIQLEEHQRQRHGFNRLGLALDPFGQRVLGFVDEVGPDGDDPGGAVVCTWRPLDTDADAVPDVVERELGLRVDVADTDEDGRTDGEELLIDGTDPAVDESLDPDAGAPEADAAAPDMAVDAAAPEPDVTVDAAAPEPDVTVDAAPPEPDVTVDAAPPEPDVTVDAAPPEPDVTVDAAPPEPDVTVDAAPPEPDVTVDAAPPEPDVTVDAAPPEPDVTVVVPRSDAAPDAAPDAADAPDLAADTAVAPDAADAGPDATERAPDARIDAARAPDATASDPDLGIRLDLGAAPPTPDSGRSAPPRTTVRFDGSLPALTSLTEDREASCACRAAGRGPGPLWFVVLLGLVGRRREVRRRRASARRRRPTREYG